VWSQIKKESLFQSELKNCLAFFFFPPNPPEKGVIFNFFMGNGVDR